MNSQPSTYLGSRPFESALQRDAVGLSCDDSPDFTESDDLGDGLVLGWMNEVEEACWIDLDRAGFLY